MNVWILQILIICLVPFCSTAEIPQEPNGGKDRGAHDATLSEVSMADMEEAREMLKNLTDVQKEALELQRTFENSVRTQNREMEDKYASRTKFLEQQQNFLKGVSSFVKRKLKRILKNNAHSNNGHQSTIVHPKDCADLYLDGEFESDVYKVWPTWLRNATGFPVYCDMETDGGGWTVIHRWGNYNFPNDFFRRTMSEYSNGFGNLESAFWLGNDMIHALTSQDAYDLRFDMKGKARNAYSVYGTFWIEDGSQSYKLHVDGFDEAASSSETASTAYLGDIFLLHNNDYFSTYDAFKPQNQYGKCSEHPKKRPGWWYSSSCPLDQAFYTSFDGPGNPYVRGEMKIRPKTFKKTEEMP